MLVISPSVTNLEGLQKHLDFVRQLASMRTDTDFQKYMSKKALEIVNQVSNERINLSPTSNEDLKGEYVSHNQIRDVSNKGFIIYNDLSVESENYTFCVALAFEYGTGLVGQAQAIEGAWAYNINENTVFYDGETIDGWWLSKDKAGNIETFGESRSGKAIVTRGYEGMEIYRYSAERIKKELPNIVLTYVKDGGKE